MQAAYRGDSSSAAGGEPTAAAVDQSAAGDEPTPAAIDQPAAAAVDQPAAKGGREHC